MADCIYMLVLQMTHKCKPADLLTVQLENLKKSEAATNYIAAVVDDREERHILLIQDLIGRTQEQNLLQNTLQVTQRSREMISKNSTKKAIKRFE